MIRTRGWWSYCSRRGWEEELVVRKEVRHNNNRLLQSALTS